MSKIIKSSVKAQIFIFIFLPFNYRAQPKVAVPVAVERKNIVLVSPL